MNQTIELRMPVVFLRTGTKGFENIVLCVSLLQGFVKTDSTKTTVAFFDSKTNGIRENPRSSENPEVQIFGGVL